MKWMLTWFELGLGKSNQDSCHWQRYERAPPRPVRGCTKSVPAQAAPVASGSESGSEPSGRDMDGYGVYVLGLAANDVQLFQWHMHLSFLSTSTLLTPPPFSSTMDYG